MDRLGEREKLVAFPRNKTSFITLNGEKSAILKCTLMNHAEEITTCRTMQSTFKKKWRITAQ